MSTNSLHVLLLAGIPAFALLMAPASGLSEVRDSANMWSDGSAVEELVDYDEVRTYPNWEDVRDKPATATRWPNFNEVTDKPTFYPTTWSHIDQSSLPEQSPFGSPPEHNHDGRYVTRSGSSTINPGSLRIITNQNIGHAIQIDNRLTELNANDGTGAGGYINITQYNDLDQDVGSGLRFQTATGRHNDRGYPRNEAHLGSIAAYGWSGWREAEGADRWLSPASIVFRANGQWDEENQWGRIVFNTGNAANRVEVRPGVYHTKYEQPIVFNMGRIAVGTHEPTHQITLRGGTPTGEENPNRGININDRMWLGETNSSTVGPDIRMQGNGYLYSDSSMLFSTGNGGFKFFNNTDNEPGEYGITGSDGHIARISNDGRFFGSAYNLLSDKRLKEDIKDVEGALRAISDIRPVTFHWKDERKKDMGRQIGLLAQNLRDVYPEVVHESEDGSLSVSYGPLVAPLISAVQELDARDSELVARGRELEDKQQGIADLIESLEQRVAELEAVIMELSAH